MPGQISLIGVDGHPTAELFGITSVDQAVAAQGRLAGRLVLDLLGWSAPGARAISAEFRLEVRSTTGPPPATGAVATPAPPASGGAGAALSARASSHSGQEGAIWKEAKVRSPHVGR